MSTPSHHPLATSNNTGRSLPNPSAARQDAGGLKNTLGLPVQLIDGWAVFDCRTGDDEYAGTVKAPWGETLWGSERAAYSMGLRVSFMGDDTTPVSVSVYMDLRKQPAEFERLARDLVGHAKRLNKDFGGARKNPAPEGAGGSVFYRPVAIAVCNFGGAVIADRRERAVRLFSHLA